MLWFDVGCVGMIVARPDRVKGDAPLSLLRPAGAGGGQSKNISTDNCGPSSPGGWYST